MPSLPHGVLDVITGLLALVAAFFLWRWARSADEPGRSLARVVLGVLAGLVGIGTAFTSHRLSDFFPQTIYVWLRALSIVAAAVLFYSGMMVAAFRRAGAFRPERRKLLKVAGTAAVAAPVCIGATSFIRRDSLQLVEADMRIAGLPPDLDGFRIVQLSDIHLSPLVSEALLARAVDMANEARGSIAVVTGDLITRIGDPLDTCL
ncbi:MAG TPA: hypothetical protein VEQ63_03515, partial [Bryobacteraceae bacterium]|nr:hypothetical protein [Bryobacteraceae bacterium]